MKVGDLARCACCDASGVVVTTSLEGSDLDKALQRSTSTPLEPSAYVPGLTCRTCEEDFFRTALPQRGVCAACGKEKAEARSRDLGATRSFCNNECINAFINRRLSR